MGAAIARGSHGENGYKALLVIKVNTSMVTTRKLGKSEEKNVKSGEK